MLCVIDCVKLAGTACFLASFASSNKCNGPLPSPCISSPCSFTARLARQFICQLTCHLHLKCPVPHCSDTKNLDVGLRVSAVKVTQRQPMELSQGVHGDSPYSAKHADGKGTMKRKGVIRSVTFSAGSSEAIDIAHLGDEHTVRSSSRGTT